MLRLRTVSAAATFFAPFAVLLALWAVLVPYFEVNPRIFPHLSAVVQAGWESVQDGTLFTHIGASLLRVVVGMTEHGQVPFRVLFCTDPIFDVVRVLEGYSGRWGIEVFFRDAKQWLGFADSAARLEHAVRRVAPLVGLLYTVLVVWFLEHHGRTFTASPPLRPWYPHKFGLSFADILRQARGAIATANILDLINDSKNFKNTPPPARSASLAGEKLAA